MPTDPARVRRSDPGDPEKCPVWQFHKVYSDEATRDWVVKGCTTAGIGCLDCKQPVIDAIIKEQQPWRERADGLSGQPEAGALDRRGGHRARAHGGRETMRTCATRWASTTDAARAFTPAWRARGSHLLCRASSNLDAVRAAPAR